LNLTHLNEQKARVDCQKRAKEGQWVILQQKGDRGNGYGKLIRFVMTPHKAELYILPFAYTSNPNDRAFLGEDSDSKSLQSVEFKFQA